MSWVGQTAAILRKDLLIEWRGRSRLVAVLLFGIVSLMLFSFAVDTSVLQHSAAGFLVLALLLSSTLALGESFRLEHEHEALEGLQLLPVEPVALYYGKALANGLFLLMLGPLLMPVALVLYSAALGPLDLAKMLGLWGLASAGLSAPGTLYAAMTSRLKGQDVLLPLLLFPLVVPVLMATVKAMSLVLTGDPMEQLPAWVTLLVAFDLIYLFLCGVLFPYVNEEGV